MSNEPISRDGGRALIRSILDKDRNELDRHIEYLGDIVELRSHPGFIKLVGILSRLYWEAAERNMEEGGTQAARWLGYREALSSVVELVDSSIDSFTEHKQLLAITERELESEEAAPASGYGLALGLGNESTLGEGDDTL